MSTDEKRPPEEPWTQQTTAEIRAFVKKSIDEYDGEAGTNLTLPLACGLGGACDEIERLRADNERLREAIRSCLTLAQKGGMGAGNFRTTVDILTAALATKGNDG
jgi:hypothetical protein